MVEQEVCWPLVAVAMLFTVEPTDRALAGWDPRLFTGCLDIMLSQAQNFVTRRPLRLVASITCPVCGRASYHPVDIREGYCGHCHDWTSEGAP